MELKYKTKECRYSSTGKSIGCSCRNQVSIPSSFMTAHICLKLPGDLTYSSVLHKYCTRVVHRHIRKQDTHTHKIKVKETCKNITSEAYREFNRTISNINNKETIMANIFQVPHASWYSVGFTHNFPQLHRAFPPCSSATA